MCLSWEVRYYECQHNSLNDYHTLELEPLQLCPHKLSNPCAPCARPITIVQKNWQFCPAALLVNTSTNGKNIRKKYNTEPGEPIRRDQPRIFPAKIDGETADRILASAHKFVSDRSSLNDCKGFPIEKPLQMPDLEFLTNLEGVLYNRIFEHWKSWNHKVSEEEILTYASVHYAFTMANFHFWTWMYHDYRHTFNQRMPQQARQKPSKSQVKKRLTSILQDVNPEELEENNAKCHFCLESICSHTDDFDNIQAVKLPCGHLFGKSCFMEWFNVWNGQNEKFRLCILCQDHFGLFAGWNGRYLDEQSPLRTKLRALRDLASNPRPRWLQEIMDLSHTTSESATDDIGFIDSIQELDISSPNNMR